MLFTTAGLCDQHGEAIRVAEPIFRDFGFRKAFFGPVTTVVTPGDFAPVAAALDETGSGRVLIVEGAGRQECALLGDRLAFLAYEHNWSGVIVHGSVRDSGELQSIDIGIKALGTCPRRGIASGQSQRDIPATFAGVLFRPGDWVYADQDGLLVADTKLF
ncbi:MAG: ribonuclease E activity regulator RraA [Acidimicrobiia bacterium]|nr:ribonuclease E activity regulator RraA [Acidimicrobiia bacterium]MDH3396880.1 ribonuclease E activity regulator RraA [Acidimicrobiia bacterium]